MLLTSCASSYLQDSTNASKVKKHYDKILVILKTNDKTARLNFENQVVKDLADKGVQASSSTSLIPASSFSSQPTEQEIESLRLQLIEDGYSGVIVTYLINKAQYSDVVPGNTNAAVIPVRYGRFGRYYGAYPVTYYEPDQVEVGMEYTLESCFYDITEDKKDNLQWVGRFQVKDPSSLSNTIEKYSKELTDQLLLESISQ